MVAPLVVRLKSRFSAFFSFLIRVFFDLCNVQLLLGMFFYKKMQSLRA